jgi:hypothetical protein
MSVAAQRDRLVHALGRVVAEAGRLDAVTGYLQDLGREHRKFGAIAEYYPYVRASLLATLAHFNGPAWTPDLAAEARTHADRVLDEAHSRASRAAEVVSAEPGPAANGSGGTARPNWPTSGRSARSTAPTCGPTWKPWSTTWRIGAVGKVIAGGGPGRAAVPFPPGSPPPGQPPPPGQAPPPAPAPGQPSSPPSYTSPPSYSSPSPARLP